MSSSPITTDAARLLVEKVRRDNLLPPRYRRRAQQLAPLLHSPALVLERLQGFAAEALPGLPRSSPTADLARVITAATFWRYHCRAEARAAFLTANDFVQAVNSESDAGRFLAQCLTDNEPLTSWQRSWLAEHRAVKGLSGRRVDRALELGKSPPFVMFVFSLADCRSHNITVRRPCSLDSVLGPNLQWNAAGLSSGLAEFVDGDLPRAAVSRIGWVT